MDYIKEKGKYPVVIKADGLALGKDVLIWLPDARKSSLRK